MDDGDTLAERIHRAAKLSALPGYDDRSGIGCVFAAKNAHQGGFAGTVLSKESMYLSTPKRKIDPLQGTNATKRLTNSAKLYEVFHD
jgi:hypothetical protein